MKTLNKLSKAASWIIGAGVLTYILVVLTIAVLEQFNIYTF